MSNDQHTTTHDDDMQPEYDFSNKHAVRGKYYQRLRERPGYAAWHFDIYERCADSPTLLKALTR